MVIFNETDGRRNEDRMAYTIQETAELLSCSERHVYNLLGKEGLRSFKVGSCRRVSSDALHEFILTREGADNYGN